MFPEFTIRLKALTIGSFLVLLAAACLLAPGNSYAGLAQWSTTSILYQYGTDFALGDSTRSLMTFEHADGWTYGDNFFFFDVENPERDGDRTLTNIYGEFSPRLSFGKMLGKDLSFAFVKDVLLAGTVEMGNGFHNFLYGVGFSLDLPKFSYFDLNLYVRNDQSQSGATYQVTPVWGLPFQAGPVKMLFEGFADFAGREGLKSSNIDIQPRLLVDVGNFWGQPDAVYVGTEYIYWHNKFGIKGLNEHVATAALKLTF